MAVLPGGPCPSDGMQRAALLPGGTNTRCRVMPCRVCSPDVGRWVKRTAMKPTENSIRVSQKALLFY